MFVILIYHNHPKFSEKLIWANCADQDQTARAVCSGTSLLFIAFAPPDKIPKAWTFFFSSFFFFFNPRYITANFPVSEISGTLWHDHVYTQQNIYGLLIFNPHHKKTCA